MDKGIEKQADCTVNDCFPEMILEFLAAGREIEKKYRSAFANHPKLIKALTHQKTLIEILL